MLKSTVYVCNWRGKELQGEENYDLFMDESSHIFSYL